MKRLTLLVLVLILGSGLLFATGGRQTNTAAATITTPVGQYPIASDGTLRYWMVLHNNLNANYTNFADTPFAQELLRRTGVRVQFEHPAGATTAIAQAAMNLMIASQDFPDIMEYNWVTYVGGPEKLIDDRTIIRLNDVMDRFTPNLKRVLAANPDWDRRVKSDNGSYYNFPFIRGHEELLYSQGLMIRKDWLDDLGLQPPQTIPEWRDALIAFRDRRGAQAPFTIVFSNRGRMFMPSFGILNEMYISAQTGRVTDGRIEPGYRQWITTMAQWYREGLIDTDVVSINTAQQNQKMTTGASGATVASVGSGMGVWTDAARPANPRYEIMALQYPVLNRGDRLVYSIPNQIYSGQDSPAISGTSNNVELAARFLDYGYTDQGHNVYNFGTEGTSWTMVNGVQTYTPMIMSGTPNRWPLAQAMSAYARGPMAGPFVQDVGYIRQFYALPEQAQALVNFVLPGATNYLLPPVIPTQAESQEYATIMQEINTYIEERTTRWLIGTDQITDATWNDYLTTVQRMGMNRAIEIQNAALARYNRR